MSNRQILLSIRKFTGLSIHHNLAMTLMTSDHATLFIMSPLVAKWLKDGQAVPIDLFGSEMAGHFPDRELHRAAEGLHRSLTTNIYKTKDGKCYHVHGM